MLTSTCYVGASAAKAYQSVVTEHNEREADGERKVYQRKSVGMHEMSPNCWPFALRFLSSMFTLALGAGGKARIRELSEPNMLPTLH